jgi:hypothetical protein
MDKSEKETVHTCHRGLIRRFELVSSVAQTTGAVGDCDTHGWRPTKAPHKRMLKMENPLSNKHMHTESNIIYGAENDCT